ncbi:hypothetical protein BGZ70_001508 [Mortierella alpina]|uniref:Uncharacterized protein n=1 Tax=Mortierella alpina TaxID=64518 RepID=A0A9P6JF41_MORAP|nr:hypothetical protein BGZ70_001508 [Mortierella alpina]
MASILLYILVVSEVLTGDYNAVAGSLLAEFVLTGTAGLLLMPVSDFSKAPLDPVSSHVDERHLEKSRTFKVETRVLRDVIIPKTIATKADEFRAIIRDVLDKQDMVLADGPRRKRRRESPSAIISDTEHDPEEGDEDDEGLED